MIVYIPISLYIDMTNSTTSAQEDKETNTLLKNKANKNTKNKTKNKKEKDKAHDDDIEADLQGICPEFKERARRRLREGKPINPLWDCYTRHRIILGQE